MLGWFKTKPQEVKVVEGTPNLEKKLGKAAAEIERWTKVLATRERGGNQKLIDHAKKQLSFWKKMKALHEERDA